MRPANQRCSTCAAWEPVGRSKDGMGECRRYAPQPGGAPFIPWRPTHDNDWCLEWKTLEVVEGKKKEGKGV